MLNKLSQDAPDNMLNFAKNRERPQVYIIINQKQESEATVGTGSLFKIGNRPDDVIPIANIHLK